MTRSNDRWSGVCCVEGCPGATLSGDVVCRACERALALGAAHGCKGGHGRPLDAEDAMRVHQRRAAFGMKVVPYVDPDSPIKVAVARFMAGEPLISPKS